MPFLSGTPFPGIMHRNSDQRFPPAAVDCSGISHLAAATHRKVLLPAYFLKIFANAGNPPVKMIRICSFMDRDLAIAHDMQAAAICECLYTLFQSI